MKIVIINQYFPPDRAATSLLLGQLASDLAATDAVTVISGSPTYNPDPRPFSFPARLRKIEIPLLPFSRARLWVRILNYFLFLAGATLRALTLEKHDVVLCWTDPPLVGWIGVLVKRFFGSRFVFVSQDVYPEVAEAVGKMNGPLSRAILSSVSKIILSSADAVVAVGHDMAKRLYAKGCPVTKVRVIPNWQDLSALRPADASAARAKFGIPKDTFVVMHSGNIGYSQDFETLLAAALSTNGDAGILYVLAGDGGRKNELEARARAEKLDHVRFLPYAPTEELGEFLSMADVHYVSLFPRLTGVIVPSKVYGILAVAKPILANVSPDSEVTRVVLEARCGWLVSADGATLASQIRELREQPAICKELGANGRSWIEANGGREKAVAEYRKVLQE